MNSPQIAELTAAALAGESLGVDVRAAGSEEDMGRPCIVVEALDFEEHETLLGNSEGRLQATLQTIPAETSLADHLDLENSVRGLLCDIDWMTPAVSPTFAIAPKDGLWDDQVARSEVEGVRQSEISLMVAAAELP